MVKLNSCSIFICNFFALHNDIGHNLSNQFAIETLHFTSRQYVCNSIAVSKIFICVPCVTPKNINIANIVAVHSGIYFAALIFHNLLNCGASAFYIALNFFIIGINIRITCRKFNIW